MLATFSPARRPSALIGPVLPVQHHFILQCSQMHLLQDRNPWGVEREGKDPMHVQLPQQLIWMGNRARENKCNQTENARPYKNFSDFLSSADPLPTLTVRAERDQRGIWDGLEVALEDKSFESCFPRHVLGGEGHSLLQPQHLSSRALQHATPQGTSPQPMLPPWRCSVPGPAGSPGMK